MIENEPAETKTGANSPGKRTAPRASRSIRFSEFEWSSIENAAESRGMTAAELVRHAAVSFATGKFAANPATLPSSIAAQIERIYRGVYLLSTLKRDEMLHDGRQETLDKIRKSAHESQAAILEEASTPAP
ncbi:MAG: hypothetical protein OXQ86_09745 [Gammaproteobacteria bacterium]|nr:hypothetical protein [Gammaproteobacteria bacterium]MDE0412773.1 hypothetical protein [Gammaproteobacteria bacterium]